MQPAFEILESENPLYLESELITYIGNKRGLLPFIGHGVDIVKSRLNKNKITFIDLFSGSGVVSRYMKLHSDFIVSNDIEYYAKIINGCYLSNRSAINFDELEDCLRHLKDKIANDWKRGFIAELYSPLHDDNIQQGERVFYTRRNAEYIDTARHHINDIPDGLQIYFLAPLLVKASIHNNTAGVFKGFYKNR